MTQTRVFGFEKRPGFPGIRVRENSGLVNKSNFICNKCADKERFKTRPQQSLAYILCSKKTCDHIFDDKLKQNYPFTKIFGTLITKSIGHRWVYLVSHLTYFAHLLYLGKLSRPKYHEFSLKFLIFSMLQY